MKARAPRAAVVTCQHAFQQMAMQSLFAVRRHHAGACRGDADAIHEIRIALTKLRAVRHFFAAMTRDATWPKLKADIDWLHSALGDARDDDVMTAYARATARKSDAKPDRPLAAKGSQSHRRLAAILRSKRYHRLAAGLTRWIDCGPWQASDKAAARKRRNRSVASYAPDRLRKWKTRLLRNVAKAMTGGRRRHRLRIAAKRYRYICDAFTALGIPESRSSARSRKAAQSVQRALGDLRDLQRFHKVQPHGLSVRRYHRRKKRLLQQAASAFQRI